MRNAGSPLNEKDPFPMSRSTEGVEDRIVAKTVDLAEIPIIDFSPFRHGGAEGKQAVAAQIAQACTDIGFFYLKGRGKGKFVRRFVPTVRKASEGDVKGE